MTLSKRKKNISIKLMTLQTKQLIIIHANNINAKKKTNVSKQNFDNYSSFLF